MAGWTMSEGNTPLHRTRYAERPQIIDGGEAVMASEGFGVPLIGSEENDAPRAAEIICDHCGQPFRAKRTDARLCSARCRKQVSRKQAA
jgi:hypothetical protein